MAARFKKRLLTHVAHKNYEPAPLEHVMAELRIPEEDKGEFEAEVDELVEEGKIDRGKSGLLELPDFPEEVEGRFSLNPRGFGFVRLDYATRHGDLFVPPDCTLDAVTGDRVRAVVHESKRKRPDQSPYFGEVVEVIERRKTHFAGELRRQDGEWLVYPDGSVLTDPVVVQDAESKNAREGDKVIVDILSFPEGNMLAAGVITKVLGEAGAPDVETQSVIENYELPGEFPEECIDQARELTRRYDQEMHAAITEGQGFDADLRRDMRDAFIVTIDPPDAKDYDDAISIERLSDKKGGGKGWRLGIHIADVSHFVEPGTPLDEEARDRANSVYLPRMVIPMLPEVLSNGICSLQEGVPRYCKSVFIDYDERGRVKATGFSATVINSAKRMTYLEAQALIDGNEEEAAKHAKTDTPYTDELKRALRDMNTLSRAIRKRRKDNGMIHLDLPEVELVFDEEGRVIDAVPEDDAFTHTIIEMFMVEANEAVARLFEELNVPNMRRIHPEPVPGNMEGLSDFVRVAGYSVPKNPTREELQGLLDATAGKPAAPAVHMAVLRTLTRAEYSPALVGHFALASEGYSHFTSPIRRYPDLLTHRLLTEYLRLTKNNANRPTTEEEEKQLGKKLRECDMFLEEQELTEIGNHCNLREGNAEAAERDLRKFLVLQLLEEHIGDSFPGVITGVKPSGIFVQLDKYLIEGMVKKQDLPGPPTTKAKGMPRQPLWKLDKKTGALVDVHSGRSFNMGDRLEVTITKVDLAKREMDLVVTDPEARDLGKDKKLAGALRFGDAVEYDKPQKTGAQRRAQRSRSRDRRKSEHRDEKKGKGKRQ